MAGETTTTAAVPGQTTNYYQPQYYTDTAASVAGGVQDMMGTEGYLNSTMGNWYNQTPGQGALGAAAQYDPTKQQNFMNPYTEGAANEVMRLSNQNLMENVLPGINTTFTGAGQFGSSRNMDMTGRAVRDNQTSIDGALATMYKNAADTANTQYKDWTQMGVNAGQQDYKNWLDQANYPVTALGTLGQVTGNLKGSPTAVSSEAAAPTDMQKIIAALGAADNGVASLQDILGLLGIDSGTPAV